MATLPLTNIRTNYVRNSTMVGDVSGTPGTLPTNWIMGGLPAGISRTVTAGLTSPSGAPMTRIRFFGTTGASWFFALRFDTAATPPVPQGNFVESFVISLSAGSLVGIAPKLWMQTIDSTPTTILDNQNVFAITGTPTRIVGSNQNTGNAGTAPYTGQNGIIIGFPTGAVDSTFDISAPQMENNSNVTDWIPTAGAAVTIGGYVSALIAAVNGQSFTKTLSNIRTNYIRNSALAGVVAGTPGTAPTFWSLQTGAGLSRQIVGSGTINGAPYVDIRLFGTATAAGVLGGNFSFDNGTGTGANVGDVWTASVTMQVLADLSDVPPPTLSFGLIETGGTTTFKLVNMAVPTMAQRVSSTDTVTAAGTTAIYASVWIVPSGTVVGRRYDITMRFSAPQVEKSANATDWIPTTTGAVTIGASAELDGFAAVARSRAILAALAVASIPAAVITRSRPLAAAALAVAGSVAGNIKRGRALAAGMAAAGVAAATIASTRATVAALSAVARIAAALQGGSGVPASPRRSLVYRGAGARMLYPDAKRSAEVLDYGIDWTAELQTDTITSVAVSIFPVSLPAPGDATVVQSNPPWVGGRVAFWIAGGVPGARYGVTVQVVTAIGRTDQAIAYLTIAL